MTIATAETTPGQEFATGMLETFGTPSGAYGQILSQDTNITQANEALVDAALRTSKIVAVHQNFKVQDLEQYAPFRRRPQGCMSTQVIRSFAAYIDKHQDDGTTVFVDAEHLRATAVLDFGDTAMPGHCDNLCTLALKNTAAYSALVYNSCRKLSQRDFADFLESWAPHIQLQHEGVDMALHQGLAAVRNITIEGAHSAQHKEESLSASRSTFESVKAKSDDAIPTLMVYKCRPAPELSERTYNVRICILTGEAKPVFQLNIIALETHHEEAAEEMSGLIRQQITPEIPVLMGTYNKQ